MPKILVNYIYNKSKDEYELLDNQKYVLADMPIAVMETLDEITTPLVVPIKGVNTVVDRKAYESVHKLFRLAADEKGIVTEAPTGAPVWLPKDTDVSKLRYINNRLVLIDPDEQENISETKDTKPKKVKGDK